MKRMIGLLMVVGMMVGVVGCGDDDNPVKEVTPSNQDLLVGTWLDEDGLLVTISSDGTLVESREGWSDSNLFLELAGTWSLAGDQLTVTYSEKDLRELFEELLAAEIDLAEVSDAEMEEVIDAFMADEYPRGPVIIMTINSITDTELITTDEDGEKDVLKRKN